MTTSMSIGITANSRYYTGRLGKVDETGKLIVGTMKEFVEGLRLKGDPVSHVG